VGVQLAFQTIEGPRDLESETRPALSCSVSVQEAFSPVIWHQIAFKAACRRAFTRSLHVPQSAFFVAGQRSRSCCVPHYPTSPPQTSDRVIT
jgi:hypothetical protein